MTVDDFRSHIGATSLDKNRGPDVTTERPAFADSVVPFRPVPTYGGQRLSPERLRKIALKYAAALKARPEWAGHRQ